MPKSPDRAEQRPIIEEQKLWGQGIKQLEIILEAARKPGTVVKVPTPADFSEEIAYSDFGLKQAFPPLLAGIGYTEDGKGLVLRNGSVIEFSRQADGSHP